MIPIDWIYFNKTYVCNICLPGSKSKYEKNSDERFLEFCRGKTDAENVSVTGHVRHVSVSGKLPVMDDSPIIPPEAAARYSAP